MANLSLSTIDQPAYQRAGGNLQPRSCGVRGRVLRTGTRPADRGDSPWTTPPRCPPPAPTRAPLAHELHKINNKFSMKRKNRKTRPFNLPLTSSSVALVQHFQHRQNKVPTTSPDRKTDSPPNSSVQAHVLIGKRWVRGQPIRTSSRGWPATRSTAPWPGNSASTRKFWTIAFAAPKSSIGFAAAYSSEQRNGGRGPPRYTTKLTIRPGTKIERRTSLSCRCRATLSSLLAISSA